MLYCLPDMIGIGPQDITARNGTVFNQFRFLNKLGEPCGEIVFFGRGQAFGVFLLAFHIFFAHNRIGLSMVI